VRRSPALALHIERMVFKPELAQMVAQKHQLWYIE
jgi:hypothetical protein